MGQGTRRDALLASIWHLRNWPSEPLSIQHCPTIARLQLLPSVDLLYTLVPFVLVGLEPFSSFAPSDSPTKNLNATYIGTNVPSVKLSLVGTKLFDSLNCRGMSHDIHLRSLFGPQASSFRLRMSVHGCRCQRGEGIRDRILRGVRKRRTSRCDISIPLCS